MMILVSPFSQAADGLNTCLNSTIYHEHRIEKEENVKFCFDKYKTTVTRSACRKAIETHGALINTYRLKLYAQNACFYESGNHASLLSCAKEAEQFIGATEHDEALFYCYQLFQDRTKKKECIAVAKKMKFSAKRIYLENHCNRI